MYRKRNNMLKVLALFTLGYSRRLFLREISRQSKVSLRTTQTVLAELEKDSILKSKTEGKNKYFFLNMESLIAKNTLLQAEVHKTNVFLKKHPEVSLFAREIRPGQLVVIFGSFARGTQTKNSDFDILITGEKKDLPLHLLTLKAHVVEISEKNLIFSEKNREALIKEVEESHIVLNNHSLYVDAVWREYADK